MITGDAQRFLNNWRNDYASVKYGWEEVDIQNLSSVECGQPMENEKDTQAGAIESLSVPLRYRLPSRMPTLYVHHLFVQVGEDDVTLSFFEVIPPYITDANKEEQIRLLQETGLTAECVARITISKARYPSFVTAMQQVLDQVVPKKQTTEDK
jgi:hypothetical protein